MTEKTLHSVQAGAERGGTHGDRRTGRVTVMAIPAWLKDGKFVAESITPARARRLAIELLTAAEDAERKL